ncbi:MAG: hypothetical protein SGJ24_04445 [Chloroflexota bacterium]|nr:hypothetical protein [Chloroflexota bacterium]
MTGRTSIATGTLTRLEWLAPTDIAKLVAVGAAARVVTVPLAVLPGWEKRAMWLSDAPIADGEQLIEADADSVAELIPVSAGEIRAWQDEMIALLTLTHDDGCGC